MSTPTTIDRQYVEQTLADAKAKLPQFEAMFPDDRRPREAIVAAEFCLAGKAPSKKEMAAFIGGVTQAASDAMLAKENFALAEEACWKISLAASLAAKLGSGATPE